MSGKASVKRWNAGLEMTANDLPPQGVIWTAMVGVLMALWSFLLCALPGPWMDSEHDKILWVVSADMFAIQNLGHSAFLILFATSWWRNRNVLGICMCQLSSLFLLFSCIGYSLVANHFATRISMIHHLIPAVFSIVLLIAFITTSRMGLEWNLTIINPRVYFVHDGNMLLRLTLLALCIVQCAEPVLVAIVRVIASNDKNIAHEVGRDPSLTLRAFIESYTLGFHQAFVMATAFAVVLVENRVRDRGTVWLAIYGQFSLVLSFGVGMYMIPSDPVFLLGTAIKVGAHMLCCLLLLEMTRRLENAQSYDAVTAQSSVGAGFQGANLWSMFSASPANSTKRRHLFIVLVASFLHGVAWQAECIVSIVLAFSSKTMMDQVNGLRNGLNFGIHGAGITIFVLVLALRSPVSFPFLKFSVLLGAVGGSVISFVQVSHVQGDSFYSWLTWGFFLGRGAIGVFLGITYAGVEYPSVDECGAPEHEENYVYYATQRKRAQISLAVYICSIIGYALTVTSLLGQAGVHAGFPNLARETNVQIMHDRWHNHRLVEFPPGYGLVFHFAFLLPGFVFHYLAEEFLPSKYISVAFTLSTSLLFTAQAILGPIILDEEYISDRIMLSCGLAAITSTMLCSQIILLKPTNTKSTQSLSGDLWH
mmetsp:Transcript_12048/g.19610  ORF Transcript_12048/g.19610 Transcript_12048/m.19610 type:complete len:649 (-) Transcript_12048:433-2379(-)|eukprot:CAMPEP_0203773754 /NCGR_PEP_ID=MMETSP0099_2-20121227/4850_1 /ASSEMBLY_ACC=CAM_ASM_000209 /TAXON_ID=96639 /ORGANISM=" , Strain NY0313808BC1" /LENGTH=648 /DNA_ID=CAMNT_0050671653 /DNA_START=218 /DNA_END=2164 /DNA_ORIENTATION=-